MTAQDVPLSPQQEKEWAQRYDDAVQPLQTRAHEYIVRAEKAEADLAAARARVKVELEGLARWLGDAIKTAEYGIRRPAHSPQWVTYQEQGRVAALKGVLAHVLAAIEKEQG